MGKHGEPIRIGKTFGKFTVIEAVGLRGGQHHWICRCACGKTLELSRHVLRNGAKKDCGCSKVKPKKVVEDLTSRTFHRLMVLGPAEKQDGQGRLWKCGCSCGGEKIARGHELKRGAVKSCGCMRRRPLIDLTGQRFGKLTVLSRAENFHGATMWNCQCECGESQSVRSERLRSGNKKDCGCSSSPKIRGPKFEDLTGRRFGRLVVMGQSPKLRNERGRVIWACKCDCGNLKEATTAALRHAHVASCGRGCVRRGISGRVIDLTGKRFGKLVAISHETVTLLSGKRRSRWKCQCDCGNKKHVQSQALRSGNTRSCGCSRRNGKPSSVEEDAFQALLANYRKSVERRNLTFTLTESQFRTLTKNDCHYCGAPPSLSGEKRWAQSKYRYNGIDRINNDVGYTPENSVAACKMCNFLKGRFPMGAFLNQIKKIYQNKFSKKSKPKNRNETQKVLF